MIKYNKIENIFKYDNQNKISLTCNYSYFKDLYFNVTEKIDGTNIGIVWDGYNISFQGRTEKSEIPKHLLKYLEDNFKTLEFENKLEQLFGEKEVIIFGEGYGFKIQNNGYLKDGEVKFIVFDIMINNKYVNITTFNNITCDLGLEKVPYIDVYNLEQALNYVSNKPTSIMSKYNNVIEGVVCKPLIDLYDKDNHRILFKIKVKDVIKYFKDKDDNN